MLEKATTNLTAVIKDSVIYIILYILNSTYRVFYSCKSFYKRSGKKVSRCPVTYDVYSHCIILFVLIIIIIIKIKTLKLFLYLGFLSDPSRRL